MYADPISWLTGPQSQNYGSQFFTGTDLGIPIEYWPKAYVDAGRVTEIADTFTLFAFGDTNGDAYYKIADNFFAVGNPQDPTQLGYSLDFSRMASTVGTAGGSRAALLGKLNFQSQPIPRDVYGESSVIPNSGIAIELPPLGGKQLLVVAYMSLVQFDGAGLWRTNHSGYATSRDGGVTWTRSPRTKWYNNEARTDQWQMISFARKTPDDEFVYVYGTQNGRFGGAKIARVPASRILDVNALPSPYTFWDGESWVRDRSRAVDVIPAPVGELSVMWHAASNQWLAGYLNEYRYAIVVRTAPNPWGPWSDENIVVTGASYPQLYGCFFLTRTRDLATPYFTMSQFGQYNVRLMRLNL